MRKLADFQNKETTFAVTLQKAIDSNERFEVPAGTYTIDEPIGYGPALLMSGVFGHHTTGVPCTEIIGTSNLGDRPLFHRRGYYCRYAGDGLNEWVSEKDANQAGTGLRVQVEHVSIKSFSEHNTALQIFNAGHCYIKNCSFRGSFRGLDCINTFACVIENCNFTAPFRNNWLDDEKRLKNAWGLSCNNNCTITECNWQGGLTGLYVYGQGNRMSGGRIERNIYGMILSGRTLNPAQMNAYWPCMQSEFFGFTMESNLRHITGELGHGCSLRNAMIIGHYAPQLDGTNGISDWGMNFNRIHESSEIKHVGVGDKYRQGARVGPGWKDAVIPIDISQG